MAIREPLKVYNSQPGVTDCIDIQDDLVTAVLDQVRSHDGGSSAPGRAAPADGDGRVSAPLLQLVMKTIWHKERAGGAQELRLSTLKSLHGVEKIVDTHLSAAFRGLSRRQRQTAMDVFNYLVTPSGGKIAEPVPDLARRTGRSEKQIGGVLDKLDHARIVRPVAAAPGQDALRFRRYEIFHDVLTPAIDRAITVRDGRRCVGWLGRRVALAGLMVAALSLGALAVGLHLRQVADAKVMQSDRLAAAAADDLPGHPLRSARQAEQALGVFRTSRAELALRNPVQSFQQARAFHDRAWQKETAVHSAVFDPANENLIAYANGAAWIGNIRTGYRLLLTPQEHKRVHAANAITFDPAGTRVAVGYADGTVVLFNASNGKQLLLIRANKGFAPRGEPVHNTSHSQPSIFVSDVQFVGSTGDLVIETVDGVGLWLPTDGDSCCNVVLPHIRAYNTVSVDPANPGNDGELAYRGDNLD